MCSIPAIVRHPAHPTQLIAMAEGRVRSCADNGKIDLVTVLSIDGGQTWSEPSIALTWTGKYFFICLYYIYNLLCECYGIIFDHPDRVFQISLDPLNSTTVGNPTLIADSIHSRLVLVYCINNTAVLTSQSEVAIFIKEREIVIEDISTLTGILIEILSGCFCLMFRMVEYG